MGTNDNFTVISSKSNGAGVRLRAIEEQAEVGALDGLLNPRVKDEGHGVVALDLVVQSLGVNELSLGAVLNLEGKTDRVPAEVHLSLLGVTNVDGIGGPFPRDGLEVKNVVLGSVGPNAEVQNHGLLPGVEGLDLELDAVAVGVNAKGHPHGEVDLDVLVKTGDVALVVPGGDEADLGGGLGGEHEVDVSGGVHPVGDVNLLVGVASKVGASLGGDFTDGVHKGGGLEGVDERQTHGGGEGKGNLVLIVQLSVAEALAALQDVSSLANILGKLLNGGVVKGEETLAADHVEDQVTLDLVIIISFDVEHIGNLFGTEGVPAGGTSLLALALLALVLLGGVVVRVIAVVLVIKLVEEVIDAGNHGTKLQKSQK
jgi:hypothetical protein